MNTLLVVLQLTCCVLNAITAGMKFSNREKGMGILYVCISALWAVAAALNMIS